MGTKYKLKTNITPIEQTNPVLYFVDSSYEGTMDVVSPFINQNNNYIGFKFLESSQVVTGLTEVYNSTWLNEDYRTIEVSNDLYDFLIDLKNARRPNICFIFKELKNCTLVNPAVTIEDGSSYTSLVSTEMVSTPTVSILMGGVDITSTAWNATTKTISISSVTGNLNINVAYSGLPSKYVELEYIESTGTQYIDTGIYATPNTTIEFKFNYVSATDSYNRLFGVSGYGGINYGVRSNSSSSISQIYFEIVHNSLTTSADTNVHTIIFNDSNHNSFYDTVQIFTNVSLPTNTSQSCYLFAHNYNSSGPSGYSNIKFYKCNIYDNTSSLRSFVPVRKLSTGEIGLFDLVSQTFFGNNGTGEFIAGPVKDLPSEYQEVEYLQSSGTQWIDTAYYTNENSTISISILSTIAASGYAQVLGAKNSYHSQTAVQVAQEPNPTVYDFAIDVGTSGVGYSLLTGINTKTNIMIDIPNKILCVNNITASITGTFSGTSQYSLWLFDCNSSGHGERNYSGGRAYYCAILENSICQRNFIPCYRKSDSKPGLYDLVNGVFYVNQGTGTDFTVGPDVE